VCVCVWGGGVQMCLTASGVWHSVACKPTRCTPTEECTCTHARRRLQPPAAAHTHTALMSAPCSSSSSATSLLPLLTAVCSAVRPEGPARACACVRVFEKSSVCGRRVCVCTRQVPWPHCVPPACTPNERTSTITHNTHTHTHTHTRAHVTRARSCDARTWRVHGRVFADQQLQRGNVEVLGCDLCWGS
jgi:hypothetical protein